jgi:E3 ubiquitin-protein ligase RNF1/2
MLNEIELVFKPHPTEMAGDNSLIKALKENSIRYIKTTANATGNFDYNYFILKTYFFLLNNNGILLRIMIFNIFS